MSDKKQVGEISQTSMIFIRITLYWFVSVLLVLPYIFSYQNYVLTLAVSLTSIGLISLELLKVYHVRKQLLDSISERVGAWWAERYNRTGYQVENTKKAISKPLSAVSIIIVFLIYAPLLHVIHPKLNLVGLVLVMVNLVLSLIQMESYSTD